MFVCLCVCVCVFVCVCVCVCVDVGGFEECVFVCDCIKAYQVGVIVRATAMPCIAVAVLQELTPPLTK